MNRIDVTVREVGLREGLQIHATFISTESKITSVPP
jgi:hypothetical protein